MLRVTLRSFWEHKRRLISTVVAVVLGVAFMAGTFVLSDTLDQVFDDLFATGNEKIDAQVQGEVLFEDPFAGDSRELLDPSLVETVAAVPGVRVAEPFVSAFGSCSANRVLGSDGEPIGASQGPPTLLQSWIDGSELTPYVVAEGRGPKADDEMALNVAAAEEGDLEVGDTVTLVTQFGTKAYTLVGTVLFGTAESSAGAVSVQLTLPEVQRLAGTPGQIMQVMVRAEEGVSQAEVKAAIAEVLPDKAEPLTGVEAAAQLSSDVQEGFTFFKTMLQIFGVIALLVAIFVISNTFAILVAQRTRELALLRAVGASRFQVLASVLVEATIVGLIAAVLGLGAGIGLAKIVTAALEAGGADLPTEGLVLRSGTAASALVIGLVVTLVAALVPAIRATRVPPLAALRDVAVEAGRLSRSRIALGVFVLAFGALNLSRAWTADGDTDAIPTVGMGAALILAGAIIIGPILAAPTIRLIGAWLPRLRGITGRLATENAARSPKRTSATASALVIGVALIAFITVFAASAKASVESELDRGFKGDFAVQTDCGQFGPPSGFSTSVTDKARGVDGVERVVGLGFGGGEFTYPDGETATQGFVAVDPEGFSEVLEPRMVEGTIDALTDDGIAVDVNIADDHGIEVGDTIKVVGPGGATRDLTVESISDDLTVLFYFTITRTTYAELVPQPTDAMMFGSFSDSADPDRVLDDVESAVAEAPELDVLDRDGLIGSLADQITAFVTIVYALLVLSIIIAMIGIANTLSLSINERTRELGLLRAVGMDRSQLRSAVRWEAVLISILGGLVGISLGLFLSWALVTSLEGFGLNTFSFPGGSLLFIVLLAGGIGTLASLRPAWRASRLPVLEAIATE